MTTKTVAKKPVAKKVEAKPVVEAPVKAPVKAETKKPVAKKASPRLVGKTTGLGVQKTWFFIFDRNEKRGVPKLTDEEITEFMNKEFPTKHSKVFNLVSRVRREYNAGKFGEVERPSTPKGEPTADEPKAEKKAPAKPEKKAPAKPEKKAPAKTKAAKVAEPVEAVEEEIVEVP